jgi:hypothetical protein
MKKVSTNEYLNKHKQVLLGHTNIQYLKITFLDKYKHYKQYNGLNAIALTMVTSNL